VLMVYNVYIHNISAMGDQIVMTAQMNTLTHVKVYYIFISLA